jgi:TPR repeat protein
MKPLLILFMYVLVGCSTEEKLTLNSGFIIPEESFSSIYEAAKAGNMESINMIADHYSFGLQESESSIGWRLLSARLGDAESQRVVGNELLKFGCSSEEWNLGYYWLKRAAENGESGAKMEIQSFQEEKIRWPGESCPAGPSKSKNL